MLATFLDDQKTPEQVAGRLYQLQFIDKVQLLDAFPHAQVPKVTVENTSICSVNTEEILEAIQMVLDARKEDFQQFNGLSWLKKKMDAAINRPDTSKPFVIGKCLHLPSNNSSPFGK